VYRAYCVYLFIGYVACFVDVLFKMVNVNSWGISTGLRPLISLQFPYYFTLKGTLCFSFIKMAVLHDDEIRTILALTRV